MIIYLTLLVVLFFCIITFDLGGAKQYREFHIRLILFALIFISGFSYRLGGDGIGYMLRYKQYGDITDISYTYLLGFHGRMPGWVLLCTLCKTVTNGYWFFKLVHAIIVNVAYVTVIKKNTKFVFTGLLFYYILIFFNQNFQILRESLAISFFFFSLPAFYEGKWLRYYILVLLSMSFHEGAAFLLLLPIMKILGINKRSIIIYVLACFLFVRFASNILEMLLGVQVEGEIQGKIYAYQEGIDSDYHFNSWSNYLLNIFFPLYILYYYYKKNIQIPYIYPVVASLLLYVVSSVVPIGYRLVNYVLIFSYILIADFLIEFIMNHVKEKRFRLMCYSVGIFSFILFKGRMYTLNYGDTNIPSYVQYYPYASIFEEYEDPTRERLFNLLRD